MQHAKSQAKAAGLASPTPAMMELKLIQSKRDIENPPPGISATLLQGC